MKMTSRIYGIAVKETVNYYEYDDIKLVFNQDTKQWSVFSNYDNLWMNGVQYHKGDLVVMFADGKVDEYKMMAQYTDTVPYINYMYTITSNFVINPSYYQNGRIEYIFEADPETDPYQFTCTKLLNNTPQQTYTLTDVDVKTFKNQHNGKLPELFTNMKVDYHGMNPESPYLPYSFTIISNSNYIKDGTTPKQINDIIIQIPTGSGEHSYFHRILDETNKHESTPKPGELPSILMTKQIGKYNAKPSVTFNRETIIRKIYHDHTKVYYNNHYHKAMYLVYDTTGAQGCWKKTIEGLALTYADPFWLCMTTTAGIEYGGRVLEAKKLVRCWKDTDNVNLTLRKTKSRKKVAPETAPYDDIIYDVVSGATNVTVTRIRRKTHIDSSGHKTTEDIQEGLPIVFDTGDSPVLCWNIEFRANNNVWTIYSKCGYIRYGGRQYPKNRSILDFNAGEEMHIEIKDETEKYEVDEVITYSITNVMVTKFIYKVWTVGESYTIKVEKSAENVDPEPWVTVNFYDAWLGHPVVIDDIQLDYDIKTNMWTLSSASDELYVYGVKYDKGEVIKEWGFNTIISIKDDRAINVIAENAEKDVKVHIDSTKSQPQGLDISEFYPSNDYYDQDFLVTHSVTKGEWVITSKRDDTYMNGVRYTYNKVIFQGNDKQGYPSFSFICQHKKDEHGPITPYINRRYTISISWDPYEEMGSMNIVGEGQGAESKTYFTREKDPAKNTIVLTKQNAKSMYGYIWKRDMPGPVPPGPEPHTLYLIIPALVYRSGRNNKNLISVYCGAGKKIIREYIKNVSGLSNDYAPDYGLYRKSYFNKFTKDGEEFGFYRKITKAPFVLIANYDGTVKCKRLAYQFSNGSYTGLDTDVTLTGTLLKNSVIYDSGPLSNAIKCDYQIIKNGSYAQYSLIKMSNPVDLGIEFHSGETFYIDDNTFVCVSEVNPEAQSLHNLYVFKNGRYFKANTDVSGYISICEDLEDEGYSISTSPLGIGWFLFDGILYSYIMGAKPREEWTDRLQSDTYKYYLIRYDPESDSTRFMYLGTNGSNNNISPILLYSRIIKCNGKYYAFRKGQSWTYSLVVPTTEFFVEGNVNEYCYEITSEADIAIIGNPVRTYQGTVTYESILPSIICNHICSINRIDINDLYIIKGFPSEYIDHSSGGDFINSIGVSPLNQLTEIGDYVFWRYTVSSAAESNQMIVAFDNPFFEQSNANFAWSLANYGINRDLN